jgi:hypothetical protein
MFNGLGTELGTISIALIMGLMAFILRLLKLLGINNLRAIFGKMPKNPGDTILKPGAAAACIGHTRELERLKERLDNHIDMDESRTKELKNDLKESTSEIKREIRDAFQRIHERIDGKQDRH